jgi:hypothetical protein
MGNELNIFRNIVYLVLTIQEFLMLQYNIVYWGTFLRLAPYYPQKSGLC